jgi:hypothetical protein
MNGEQNELDVVLVNTYRRLFDHMLAMSSHSAYACMHAHYIWAIRRLTTVFHELNPAAQPAGLLCVLTETPHSLQ